MRNKLQSFFYKKILINQLMQLYSFLLIGVISILLISYSVIFINTKEQEAKKIVSDTSQQITDTIKANDDILTNVLWDVSVTANKFDNLRNYMMLSTSDYFNYSLDNWHQTGSDDFFPDILKTILSNFPVINSMDIYLDEANQYLHVTREYPSGVLFPGTPVYTNQFTLKRPITLPNSTSTAGNLSITYEPFNLARGNSKDYQISTYLFDSNGKLIYENNPINKDKLVEGLKQDFIKNEPVSLDELSRKYMFDLSVTKGLTTVVLLSKKNLLTTSIRLLIPIIIIGVFVMVVLVLGLDRVFRKYSKQVSHIVEATNKVSEGNLTTQIDTDMMQLELKDVAVAINQMIRHLNQYIEDVYLLEVKQKDAHMRALQSQINPHFMYNTLEYIRMYALSEGQDELADVVFAFSSLLRNNIDQAKTISLEDELRFCEKYVYLFQMRYPDSIAYHFDIDDSLEHFIVPKFMIQPFIENYFVHGMDHTRQDNAISIKAKVKEEKVEIRIKDNGRGMTLEQLKKIRDNLSKSTGGLQESIGIKNVYQRVHAYFGEQAEFEVLSTLGQGVEVVITIDQEEE